ncbi:MAG: hypothetical protein ACI9WC_001559 [Arenicella sp.]|jgi:hypothetical protein
MAKDNRRSSAKTHQVEIILPGVRQFRELGGEGHVYCYRSFF